jgi:hypothetical protein
MRPGVQTTVSLKEKKEKRRKRKFLPMIITL